MPLKNPICRNHSTIMQTDKQEKSTVILAESEGFFGVLPYSFASLRSLTTDFQTVHRTVFIGKADRPCSNPLLSYQQKIKGIANAIPFILGGE